VFFVAVQCAAAVKVHEWKMENNLNDTSGNGNTGSKLGNPQYVSGYSGKCLLFDGIDDGVSNVSASGLPSNSSDSWSINMFVYVDTAISNWMVLGGFGNENDGVDGGSRYITNGEGISFWAHNVDIYSFTDIAVGSWQMLTATYDGSTLRLYRDGQLLQSEAATLANAASHIKLTPGKWGWFDGKIDEFTIWDGVLSVSDMNILRGMQQLTASNPSPENNATNISLNPRLSWDAPDVINPKYNVYWGTDPDTQSLVSFEQDDSFFDPNTSGNIVFLTDYYWRVDVVDGANIYQGDVWTFKTRYKVEQWGWDEKGTLLLEDGFATLSGDWQPVYLEGTVSGGSFSVSSGKLNISLNGNNKIYGAYNTMSLSGHFCVDVEFANDDYCGLGLIRKNASSADTNNFTSIRVNTNVSGKVKVKIRDRQSGTDDVLDNTGQVNLNDVVFGQKRYDHTLDGSNTYSVPFTSTNKKFRIFRDDAAGFFHFYYAVKALIHGEWADGWMEIAPSKDWAAAGQEYYVVLYARSGNTSSVQAIFDNLKVMQKPTADQDDSTTGFAVNRREYNWSGFTGDAIVVSFGDGFAFNKDHKFVFWSETNYVPAWHLGNQLLYSYEFLETWGGGQPGCHEPMGDRILRWSNVEVLEDNDVRKVVHWQYVLANPDYKIPNDGVGPETPEADEWWTFYPDGTGTRRVRYSPKPDFTSNHEISELIAISGSTSRPEDHHTWPALTVLNLEGDVDYYHTTPSNAGSWNTDTANWNQFIMAAHFNSSRPDAFSVFSHANDTPETYSYYPFTPEITWHQAGYGFAHWPVGKEPYHTDEVKSMSTWTAQVQSNGLLGVELYDGTDWGDHYELDERGRKYREWVSLVGLNAAYDNTGLKNKTRSWLYPGAVAMQNASSVFNGINFEKRSLTFTNIAGDRKCKFSIGPGATTLINPILEINNWGDNPIKIVRNGTRLKAGTDYIADIEGATALIWINSTLTSTIIFDITDCPVADLDSDCDVDMDDLRVFVDAWISFDTNANFGGSNLVDYIDFSAFAEDWLLGTN
jgi:Concanavalin A-like lectin/glucanases superfamily